jgi:hypothetical protein
MDDEWIKWMGGWVHYGWMDVGWIDGWMDGQGPVACSHLRCSLARAEAARRLGHQSTRRFAPAARSLTKNVCNVYKAQIHMPLKIANMGPNINHEKCSIVFSHAQVVLTCLELTR